MSSGPVIRLDDVALKPVGRGDKFEAQLAQVAASAGAVHLGARLTVVPPGKRAWPFHCHHANDELFVILAGEGTLRFGRKEHRFAAGDLLVCPCGGPQTAHQIVNTGTQELRYLAISSMREPDVMEYPDSGKWGALAGSAPGGAETQRTFAAFVPADAAVGYWEGEAD